MKNRTWETEYHSDCGYYIRDVKEVVNSLGRPYWDLKKVYIIAIIRLYEERNIW